MAANTRPAGQPSKPPKPPKPSKTELRQQKRKRDADDLQTLQQKVDELVRTISKAPSQPEPLLTTE